MCACQDGLMRAPPQTPCFKTHSHHQPRLLNTCLVETQGLSFAATATCSTSDQTRLVLAPLDFLFMCLERVQKALRGTEGRS